MPTRRNGQEASNGLGTYTPSYRAKKLKELLALQKEVQLGKPHVQLITNQELVAIQTIWYRDLIFDHKVSDIYNTVYQREFTMKNHDERKRKEEELLKKACKDDPMDFKVIQDALLLMKNKSLLTKKRGLKGDLEKLIEKAVNEESK